MLRADIQIVVVPMILLTSQIVNLFVFIFKSPDQYRAIVSPKISIRFNELWCTSIHTICATSYCYHILNDNHVNTEQMRD